MSVRQRVALFFAKVNLGITSFSNLVSLYEKAEALNFLESKINIFQALYRKNSEQFSTFFSSDLSFHELLQSSKSQLGQDLLVLVLSEFKHNGFFVEFGATNGISNSNTYLLEKKFGWRGILCEPARFWKIDLVRNRNAEIDFDCVWRTTGENIVFNETSNTELSTIIQFSGSDLHSKDRIDGKRYEVKTVSLNDLLTKYNAPFQIDYLSIDTEGSEFDILNSFDFSAHSISLISCEHNYSANRERVNELLSTKGYRRFYTEFSEFDDWYIHNSLTELKGLI